MLLSDQQLKIIRYSVYHHFSQLIKENSSLKLIFFWELEGVDVFLNRLIGHQGVKGSGGPDPEPHV